LIDIGIIASLSRECGRGVKNIGVWRCYWL